ncbi:MULTISPECIES: PP2C family protein-serine/threonine phosphatase [Priestia]|jgi:phosphoserine phosphatase RsbU/P|uniref:Phosphoserine phosphatase RsbU n=9 Tax=Priestia TaxID=2800373 RepID=D5DWT8_PRIM1|nr:MULTISPECIES: PP2C family protein-serine/threonine phosphatase [Priestia]AVX06432.1 phosphoserine phosphatase [Bacillus sp. Y-01]KOP77355.1 phosphoserine phosphatase [Bacillus sp. FJAT-21351]KQU20929.1 phosphoserine phosphatase [Bacillus sp. Leaf75]KRF58142.1 phosphoserine phosphatase [Bacillus sp. Soil531]MBK0010368.1 PP2C family protein-serine/threonine phosphatase [Bacillus sp. S35]MBK0295817.1 PP2C family protein-serine/threonine phosphatase [Bacillus sp. S34]MBU8855522.1 PP2C family 
MSFDKEMRDLYKDILGNYIQTQNEQILYQGQKLSRKSLENEISPEDIVSIHKEVIEEIYSDIPEKVLHSLDFLLEVMISYGLALREHQTLKNKQRELRSEIEVAANVQQTLLGTKVPASSTLEIGAISVPAKQMNGDYFHFVEEEHGGLSIAIADVIGKGIPAAMCMSMIKYAMDSLPDSRKNPSYVLENLNNIVERNVDPSMFITMFYGSYNPETNLFDYASAGHEPGFYYDAKADSFEDLEAKGLVLGVDRHVKYLQYEQQLSKGDMIVLLTDGVTECRTEEGFIERLDIIKLIRKYMHLSPQEIVESVYKELEKLQHFQLRDDFTLIILKSLV